MPENRSLDILEAAIREFISTGEPVSSSQLFSRYDFGIRPAMIRAELSRLADEGYLEQPYHSAGRVPSDKGYEFFAKRALAAKEYRAPETLGDLLFEGRFEDFLNVFSDELGLAGALAEGDHFMKEGLDSLMENLAWNSREEVLQVVRDFEDLDKRASRLTDLLGDDFLDVFIGSKSPVTKSEGLSVIAGDYDTGGGRVFIFAIGPKRMNYEKAASLLKGLKYFNNQQ